MNGTVCVCAERCRVRVCGNFVISVHFELITPLTDRDHGRAESVSRRILAYFMRIKNG